MDKTLTTELGVKKRFVKPKKILYGFYIDVKLMLFTEIDESKNPQIGCEPEITSLLQS